MKNGENFAMLEELADKLGGAGTNFSSVMHAVCICVCAFEFVWVNVCARAHVDEWMD